MSDTPWSGRGNVIHDKRRCPCHECHNHRKALKQRLAIKLAEQGKRRPSQKVVRIATDFLKP